MDSAPSLERIAPHAIGLDIGGANLKIADASGQTFALPFALWKHPELLGEQLARLRREFLARYYPAVERISGGEMVVGVTMTGELCDCFADKAHGVGAIVAATESALGDWHPHYYQTTGHWATAAMAIQQWSLTAASNWHALARLAGRFLPQQSGILLDIGSTTTDLIPIAQGWPATVGTADFTRTMHSELLYTGIVRSPVCAVTAAVQLGEFRLAPAHECFANMLDVYLLTGALEESSDTSQTLDGQPATRQAAQRRLARMWGAEPEELPADQWLAIARQIQKAQFDLIRQTLLRLLDRQTAPPNAWLVSGQGDWLAAEVVQSVDPQIPLVYLRNHFSKSASQAAPAVAIAQLLQESQTCRPQP